MSASPMDHLDGLDDVEDVEDMDDVVVGRGGARSRPSRRSRHLRICFNYPSPGGPMELRYASTDCFFFCCSPLFSWHLYICRKRYNVDESGFFVSYTKNSDLLLM